jgi:transcriptional regulator with XRE-family HTH domain
MSEAGPPLDKFRSYQKKHRDARDEKDRQARAENRERELVRWVHELGRAMRRLREASGLSDEELASKLGDPSDDLKHLDDGFSDRVQVGDVKSFVDGCGGFLDVIVYDKDGQIVSARELAPIGESATRPTRGARPAIASDEEALTERVTANVLQRLALALETTLPLKEGDRRSSYTLHEPLSPPFRTSDDDPA